MTPREGIDPGWHTNPGEAGERRRRLAGSLADKIAATATLDDAGPALRRAAAAAVRDVVVGEPFERLHAGAVARGAARNLVMQRVKAGGGDKAAQQAAADVEAPWDHAPLPIAVMPMRLEGLRGALPPTVTATDAAIAHSWASHPIPAADWLLVQRALDRGEIHTDQEGGRIWAFVLEAGRHFMAVMVPRAGAWRLLTFYEIPERYRERQRSQDGRVVVMDEEEERAGGGP